MKLEIYVLNIPMKTAFSHSVTTRKFADCIILKLDDKGKTGIGECVPRKYVTGETVDSVINDLLKIDWHVLLSGVDFSSSKSAVESIALSGERSKLLEKGSMNAWCVIEMALFDFTGKYFNKSVSELLQNYHADYKVINSHINQAFATSQVLDFSLTPEEFLKKRGPFHFIKIKVGKSIENDVHTLETIRKALGYDVKISVDVNMGWTFDEAMESIPLLDKYNICYYEEPFKARNYEWYQRLRQKLKIKILCDETVCSIDDAKNAVEHNSCDAINIRISKCGGLLNSIKLMEFCRDNGLEYQIGAQVAETGPLIAAGRHLAAVANGYFTYEAGQPDRYFEKFICSPMPLVDRKVNMAYHVDGSGLGVSLNKYVNLYSVRKINLA